MVPNSGIEPLSPDYQSSALAIELIRYWWFLLGLNQRPYPCKGSALPLRQGTILIFGGYTKSRTWIPGLRSINRNEP